MKCFVVVIYTFLSETVPQRRVDFAVGDVEILKFLFVMFLCFDDLSIHRTSLGTHFIRTKLGSARTV